MKTQLDRQQQVNAWHTNFSRLKFFFLELERLLLTVLSDSWGESRHSNPHLTRLSRLILMLYYFSSILFPFFFFLCMFGIWWGPRVVWQAQQQNENNKRSRAGWAAQTVVRQRSRGSPYTWRDKNTERLSGWEETMMLLDVSLFTLKYLLCL